MIDEKVVSLRGDTRNGIGIAPPESVIAFIEEILAEAKSGKIAAIGLATVSHAGYISSGFATSGTPHGHHLVAAALYLLRRCERNAGLDE